MENSKFRILKTEEFNIWMSTQTSTIQFTVFSRLHRIATEGYFGKINYFDGILELKWRSGLRVYTARLGIDIIVILGGGNKNGQSKDIKKAKNILVEIKKNGPWGV